MLIGSFQFKFFEKWLFSKAMYLLSAKETVVTRASNRTVDGIFYFSVLKIAVEGRDIYLVRYFEDDTFSGYFEIVADIWIRTCWV